MSVLDRIIRFVERFDWPVFTLEMRRSKRSEKSFFYMLVIAALMSVIGTAVTLYYFGFRQAPAEFDIRVAVWLLVSVVRFIYVFFVVPAYSSRTIAAEREMQRFENLALTTMSSWQIIIQKAAQPMLYALAITIVLAPLDLMLGWSLGSMGILSVVGPIYFLVQTAIYAGIGMLCSSLCSRARTASTVTYVIILFAPLVSSMLWMTFGITIMALTMSSQIGTSLFDVFGGLISGVYGVAIGLGITLLCLFLASRRLESLRNAV